LVNLRSRELVILVDVESVTSVLMAIVAWLK